MQYEIIFSEECGHYDLFIDGTWEDSFFSLESARRRALFIADAHGVKAFELN